MARRDDKKIPLSRIQMEKMSQTPLETEPELHVGITSSPIRPKENRFGVVVLQASQGKRVLKAIEAPSGVQFWTTDGQTARYLSKYWGGSELFKDLQHISDLLTVQGYGNIKVTLCVIAPKEGTRAQLWFGLIGAAVSLALDARHLSRIKELVESGELKDPESGDDIVKFTDRLGWRLIVV